MTKAELDLEVAVKILGLSRLKLKKVPKYSSDMRAATVILDAMRKKGHRWLLVSSEEGYFLRNLVNVTHVGAEDVKHYTADRPIGQVATTPAELAKLICEAALQEIGK